MRRPASAGSTGNPSRIPFHAVSRRFLESWAEMTTKLTSCDELTGRLRDICEGTVTDLSVRHCNVYRARWGLRPLPDCPPDEPVTPGLPSLGPQPSALSQPSLIIRGWN